MRFFVHTPLSLFSIPLAWTIAFAPFFLKTKLINKTITYDNVQPRGNLERLIDNKVDPEIIARVQRMEGAHSNGNEQLPMWVAAVLAANVSKFNTLTTNILALVYILLRILYTYVYINHKTNAQSQLRTVLFMLTISVAMALIVGSAVKLIVDA